MSDRRLQVFHTVAQQLSFTKAAECLQMTQPAVTFQVRQLEEHFNTRLFDRTHNRISLTKAGKLVYRYSDRIFQLYEDMEGRVRDLTENISGVLMLGASMTIAEYMLPALLKDFNSTWPDVNIRLKVSNTEGVVSMIENKGIDLGVVEAPVTNKNMVVELARVDHMVVAVPPGHSLAGKESATADEWMKFPYICREEGSGTREIIKEYLESNDHDSSQLQVMMELGSPEAIKGAVEAGIGMAVVSKTTIAKELALGTLVAVKLDPPLERPISFVYRKQKFRMRAMQELLDFARGYCSIQQ